MFLDKVEARAVDYDDYKWDTIYSQENGFKASSEFSESTYFKCIKILSESIAKMPINLKISTEKGEEKLKQHYLYDLLRYRPNEYMSAIDFWKCIEANRQHKGESFALITRDGRGKITGLYPINVTKIIIDNNNLITSRKKNKIMVIYQVDDKEYSALYSDVLHFKGFTLDGINSISVKDNLKNLISTNKGSTEYQVKLFQSNMTNKAIVQMTSDVKDKIELKKIQRMFDNLYSDSNRIMTIPAGYNLSTLNLTLSDAQFEQLKKLNAVDLASSFGVPAYFLGFTENYNNNSLEQTSLSFLVNTLLPLITEIEQELNYKLLTQTERKKGYYFEFNQGVLLRVDAKTQADIITKYVQTSIYKPNEARRLLGYPLTEEGDDLIVTSGVYKLKDLGKQKEGDSSGEGS